MQAGDTYKSNEWGDMVVVEFLNTKAVTIMFVNTGNCKTTHKGNILRGLVKDSVESARITQENYAKIKVQRDTAEAKLRAEKERQEELEEHHRSSRVRWRLLVQELRKLVDQDGVQLLHRTFSDRLGFKFKVVGRNKLTTAWWIRYEKSGNTYKCSEASIKAGTTLDKYSPECMEAECLRWKLAAKDNYEKNREHRISLASAYQRNNPDKVRVRNRNRHARRKGAAGTHTLHETLALLEKQDGKCACCGVPLDDTRHLDHIIPLSKGGSNWIHNLQWLCPFCNVSKNDLLPEEWHTYTQTDSFKRRRLERLSTEHEDWKLIVQSMPLLYEFSLCCDSGALQ
jgi:5-methylcytosine-specific restriction endonuclease McrA